MEISMEGRASDSPYIDMIWRGQAGKDYAVICPAASRWHLLFHKQDGRVKVSAEGPITRARPTTQPEGAEFLVIEFKLGIFLPKLPVDGLVDTETVLPLSSKASFWLHGSTWQLPDYDNAEIFVARLVRQGLMECDPVVSAALQEQPQELSERTVRRRFQRATGLTPTTIQQIERAQYAMTLLGQGHSLLDATYQAGYADQPHMTRSLKHYIGYTPAQIASNGKVE
ncbi:helix-turn-helix transcriptional regulator [Ktedonospora formicarum]|nr:helix-turn-helix transcriptional regulator [Ktedonospora formicarum]